MIDLSDVVVSQAINPVVLAALMTAGFKGLSSLFGSKRADKQRDITVAGLDLRQKMSEDKRRAMLALANGLLGGVPSTTAGGGVRTNVALDPALFASLDKERDYDFGPTVQGGGGLNALLESMFGGAAETVPYMLGGGPTVPTAAPTASTPSSPSGGPFDDPNFNLPEPTVTLDDLRLEEDQG